MKKNHWLPRPVAINYFVIPTIVILVAIIGSLVTSSNLESWYSGLVLPSFAPPGKIIGAVWTTLYVLITAGALIYWNKVRPQKNITALFITNAFLNLLWSFVFFGWHWVGWGVFVSGLMGVTIYALIYLLYSRNKTAAFLLIPYAAWVTFATYLNYLIYSLNY